MVVLTGATELVSVEDGPYGGAGALLVVVLTGATEELTFDDDPYGGAGGALDD